ncbi:uncharacterized protein [Montipora foliosa]
MNSMAVTYTDKAKRRRKTNERRQNIYSGTEYDWDSNFPPIEEPPIWPPDYSAWPQTPTQTSSQLVSQIQQMVPTQAPIQGPYQVPAAMTTQNGPPYSPLKVTPNKGSQSGKWQNPLKTHQDAMHLPLRLEDMDVRNASRVCSPGPPLGRNPLFRNCLIIGDSISLGYLTTVKSELQGLCQVQHAPFAKGSGAVDSRYGVKCLSMILATTALEPTNYDAIVFNFGMHDIDYSKVFPEEFVPLEEYSDNLVKIKDILFQTGAQVAFALTTPVPVAGRRHRRVVKYNTEARRVMEEDSKVEIADLYSAVTHVCGEPPYSTCSIMKRPKDVHFNPQGNRMLGVLVAATLRKLLSKAKPRGHFTPPKARELSAREGLASSYFHDDTSFCPDMVTRCPARSTCSEDLLSLTGYGCCMEADAVICPDSWHCCPRGSHCSPSCNFRSCKCLSLSSSPSSAKLPNEEKKKEADVNKMNTGSFLGSKFAKDKPDKPEKLVPPAKTKKQGHVSMKHLKADGEKDGNKTEKRLRKHKKMKKISGRKSINHHRKKTMDVHIHDKMQHKIHMKDRNNTKEKIDRKLHNKDKLKKTKKKEPILWNGMEAARTMHENIIKAHPTHRKTNYHAATKQHWVTQFGKGLGLTKGHKPNIKFVLTWGNRKHQNLSYRSNGKQNLKSGKHISMKEELKHLIIKHRQDLRARLKLLRGKAPCILKDRRTTRKKGKTKSSHRHKSGNKQKLRLHMHEKFTKTTSRVIHQRTSKLKHFRDKSSAKLAKSINVLTISKSGKENVMTKEAVDKVRKENKKSKNSILLGGKNDETFNNMDFHGLRQISSEKALVKENIFQESNRAKSTENDSNKSKNYTSGTKITINDIDSVGQSSSGRLRNSANTISLKNNLTIGSNALSQNASFKRKKSQSTIGKEREKEDPAINNISADGFEDYSPGGSVASQDELSGDTSGFVLTSSPGKMNDRALNQRIIGAASRSGFVPLSSLMAEYGGYSGDSEGSADLNDEESLIEPDATAWNATEKMEEDAESHSATSNSGIAQTRRSFAESGDGFAVSSSANEVQGNNSSRSRNERERLDEETKTSGDMSGSGSAQGKQFLTEPDGELTAQSSETNRSHDSTEVQNSTKQISTGHNVNSSTDRDVSEGSLAARSLGNTSLPSDDESASSDYDNDDPIRLLNSDQGFDEGGSGLKSEDLSSFDSTHHADHDRYLSSPVDKGKGFHRDLVVSGSGVERLTTSYGNGFHFEEENEDGDNQLIPENEDFHFGADSLLCVISPDCKT